MTLPQRLLCRKVSSLPKAKTTRSCAKTLFYHLPVLFYGFIHALLTDTQRALPIRLVHDPIFINRGLLEAFGLPDWYNLCLPIHVCLYLERCTPMPGVLSWALAGVVTCTASINPSASPHVCSLYGRIFTELTVALRIVAHMQFIT